LKTCHPLLQDLLNDVIKYRDCTILFGYRGRAEQEEAFKNGRSKAHFGQSQHNFSPSLAVDSMPFPINWEDIKGIHEFAGFVLGIAAEKGIPVRWGGHFKNFFDGPHFELIGFTGELKE
jgi:hypothetical protein